MHGFWRSRRIENYVLSNDRFSDRRITSINEANELLHYFFIRFDNLIHSTFKVMLSMTIRLQDLFEFCDESLILRHGTHRDTHPFGQLIIVHGANDNALLLKSFKNTDPIADLDQQEVRD